MREGAAEIVVVHAQRFAERHRVFERHAGALRQVLQRRMRGVAEQRGEAERPLADRLAVGGGEDIALLVYTSDARAVCLSHRAVLANRAQAAALLAVGCTIPTAFKILN